MSNEWKRKNLREIAEYFIGLTYSPKDVSKKGLVVLRSANIQNGKLDFSDIVRVNKRVKEQLLVKDGDILMCARNGSKKLVGKTAMIKGLEEEMTFGTFMMIIRSDFNPFLSYFFSSDEFRKQIAGGENTMISQITRYMLDDVLVPFPPPSEQIRVVEILDEVFAAIDKAKTNLEKNLQNAKELLESQLQNLFLNIGDGWEEKQLKEVFEIKPPKSEAKNKLHDDDLVSFLPMEDLPILAYEVCAKQKRKLKDVIGSYTYFTDNDVLLAKITPCFENGKIGLAKNLTNGIGFGSSEYIVFRSKGTIIPEYLYHFLSQAAFRREGSMRMSGAVGHKRVTKEFIEEYIVSFPRDKKEQLAIVQSLNNISSAVKELENIYERKLSDLDELKKSFLQKAFAGELTLANKTLMT